MSRPFCRLILLRLLRNRTITMKQPIPTISIAEAVRSPVTIGCLAVTLAATAAAYHPALGFWWGRWFEKDSYYSHGPFVPLAVAFLVWVNHKRLGPLPASPCLWGYPLMVMSGLFGWIAWMGASASVMGFTIPLLLIGTTLAVLGKSAARQLAFPISLLWFAAPPPESMLTAVSVKSQLLSISAATSGLNLLGIHVVSRGTFIDLPSLTVEVGSACSGYRLLVSMIAIASFFAYIRRGPLWGKVALVVFALPLSLAVNSLRIMAISMVGQQWGASTLRAVHDWTGYALLLVTAGLLLLFARLVGCAQYREMPLA
jgi:exosortase